MYESYFVHTESDFLNGERAGLRKQPSAGRYHTLPRHIFQTLGQLVFTLTPIYMLRAGGEHGKQQTPILMFLVSLRTAIPQTL